MRIGKAFRARRGMVLGALAPVLAAMALAVATSSGASPASVLVGGVPVLAAGVHDAGAMPSQRRLSLTVILRPRDAAALKSFAQAVSTPGSLQYHHYLGVRAFAARFGADPSSLARVRRALRRDGLHVGALARNRLSLTVSGSVERISRTFGVRLRDYRVASGRRVYANASPARVPAALGDAIAGVLGLNDLGAVAPAGLAAVAPQAPAHAPRARAAASPGAPAACGDAAAAATSHHAYTIDQIDHAYGIDGLYPQGNLGAGITVALIEAEQYPTLSTDIGTFSQCYFGNLNASVTPVPIDGGAHDGVGEETSVDIQNTLGVAPGASILVYQGPGTEQGIYDTMAATITDGRRAQVIQDAWAECETMRNSVASSLLSGENMLLQEAAVQGQTFLTSSGDRGSEGCQRINDPTEVWGQSTTATQLAVEDPAGQPFATAVGGTELTALGPAPTETVWNQLGWGAGGGGISNFWPMAPYQKTYGAPGVINSYSSPAPCGGPPSGYCREVPDVSASASTRDGYIIFYGGDWTAVGGTSTSTPVWAGIVALADASNANGCSASAPLGFLNPALYEVAAGAGAADAFHDVVSGDNNPQNVGPYPATAGYDMATGLGSPIVTDGAQPGLVAQLCQAASGGQPGSAPTISSVSAAEAAVGATLTINGSGFTPFSRVMFGTNAASSISFVNATQLKVAVPPGSGVVNITVTTTAGTSSSDPGTSFTYAPTASIGSPADGAGYTEGQSVSASYSCAASTPGTPTCAAAIANGAPIDTSVLGHHQFTVTATDANQFGTTTTSNYTVVAPPTVAIASPAPGATYLQGQALAANFNCSSTSPVVIASCSAPAAAGGAVDTSTLGSHSFTVTATDSNGFTATQTVSYQVVVGPQTQITTPANGGALVRGASVVAVFTCSAAAPAQISACVGTTTNGHVDTSTVGSHHFTVTATDSTGVVTTTTVSYTVVAAKPQLSAVRQTAAHWLAHAPKHRTNLHVGTIFSFTLDQPAKVTLRFSRTASGRLHGGRCVAAAKATTGRSCRRSLPSGAISVTAERGANAVSFSGHTPSGTLAAGSYAVTLSAVGLSGQPSAPVTLRFAVAAAN